MYQENGFSLIEVSIASLLIMLGVTGYVTLQSEYAVASAKLNLRDLALHLAQKKLDDLSYFQQLDHADGLLSYQSIATNMGGTIPAGKHEVVLSSEMDKQTYDIQWQVENRYYVDTNYDGFADSWTNAGEPFSPANLDRHADLKRVWIRVTWLNVKGNSKQLDVFGNIAPIAQSQSFQAKYRLISTLAKPWG